MSKDYTIQNIYGSININFNLIKKVVEQYVNDHFQYKLHSFAFDKSGDSYYAEINVEAQPDVIMLGKIHCMQNEIKKLFKQNFGIHDLRIFVNVFK